MNRKKKRVSKNDRKAKKIAPMMAIFYGAFNSLVTSNMFKPPKKRHSGQSKVDAEVMLSKAEEKRARKRERNLLLEVK